MKRAIQFGAGNIGRGFIGYLLSRSGYHVVFADVIEEIIEAINENKEYNVEVVGEETHTERVDDISAIMSTSEKLIEEMNRVSLITTAVGPKVLKIIAKTLAQGIKFRLEMGNEEFLNIIACENMGGASEFLKQEVLKHLENGETAYLEKYVGFPNCAVDRIVPPYDGERSNIADVRVEEFSEWIVDETEIKGNLAIEGMELTDNLTAYLERKLFTLNTGHAITAYIGYYKGYKTIKESIEDESIEEVVKAAMMESGNILIKEYSFENEAHQSYIEKILSRFKNPYLVDEVVRVGREPLRKLGYNDRLIKPFRMAVDMGLPYENLLTGIVYALKYDFKEDEDVVKKEEILKEKELNIALSEITGLEKDSKALKLIVEEYKKQ